MFELSFSRFARQCDAEKSCLVTPLVSPGSFCLHYLHARTHTTHQVAKRLLLLHLHELPGSPGHASPECLQFFTAEERMLKRWVPSSTRV
jgi:hypothetical protein